MRSFLGTLVALPLWVLLRVTLLLLRPRPAGCALRPEAPAGRVLVTGRIDNKNWCLSHLLPLAKTAAVSELILVVDGVIAPVPKTRQCPVPSAIGWLKPRAIIRSLWAVRVAIKERPDIVMAYCFFPAGLFALWAARLTGAAAVVQMAGGVQEIESGGIVSERPLLPAFFASRLALLWQELASRFDAVVVRGHRAKAYVEEHSHPGRIEVIAGSVNLGRFNLGEPDRTIDVAFVGSITPRKQPEQICQVIDRVRRQRPGVRVAIAGQGPLLGDMKDLARKMGIEDNMLFLGHVEKVEGLLARSRIFLLTSRLEGLSIAMAEAMTAGAVPVVPRIDDLSELVADGVSGWLIEPGDIAGYAERICALLDDTQLWLTMSNNARRIAVNNNGLEQVVGRWQHCLEGVLGRPGLSTNPKAVFPCHQP